MIRAHLPPILQYKAIITELLLIFQIIGWNLYSCDNIILNCSNNQYIFALLILMMGNYELLSDDWNI